MSSIALQATSGDSDRLVAAVAGYDRAFLVASVVFLATTVTTAILLPRGAPPHPATDPATPDIPPLATTASTTTPRSTS